MWDPVWEDVFINQSWGSYPGEDLIRFVARNFYRHEVRSNIHVLEIGCGPGANLWFLAREGFSFAGIDGSASAIELASKRLDNEIPDWRSRGSLHVGDVERLPFANSTFDAVIDNECIYCNSWESSVDIYNEMARVTKHGGKLFSRTFASGSWGDSTGTRLGENFWLCSEGPLCGKGPARFTKREDIRNLIQNFRIDTVEELQRTELHGVQRIIELLILGTKES